MPDKPNVIGQPFVKLPPTTTCGRRAFSTRFYHTERPEQHPDYAQRLEKLPEYRESLHTRYPPVCANCMPAVEEEIRKKDHMARTKALGGWLNDSRGKGKRRKGSGSSGEREKLQTHLFFWRLRGLLWFMTLAVVLVVHSTGASTHVRRPITIS
jgi:hypothetical protein